MNAINAITVKIILNDKGNPPGKLADAELHFGTVAGECRCGGAGEVELADGTDITCPLCAGTGTPATSPLSGLKLIGFSVWERRDGHRNVTFPARQYSVNGERRSFALLRPATDTAANDAIRDLILAAYAEHDASVAA